MSFGITPNGFNIKRLQEIKQSIEEDISSRLGAVDQSPSSLLGNLNSVIAEIASEVWEQLEKTYHNFYPNSAENIGLDNAVLFNGLTRLQPSSSRVETLLIGNQGINVPTGTQLKTNDSGEVFETEIDKIISQGDVLRVKIAIDNIINSHDYTITINSVSHTYTSDASATKEEIIDGLITELSIDTSIQTTNLDNDFLQIMAIDRVTPFSCSLSIDMSYEEIGTPVDAIAINKGSIAVPIGTLTLIETPVFGLNAVENITEGISGRETETDNELRLRREESLQILGAATFGAILSRLQNELEDVKSVRLYQNVTDLTDSFGRPPHSIEAVIEGGNDQLIFEKLQEIKGAGIETHGNIIGQVIDSQGVTHVLRFTRPTKKYAFIIYNGVLSSESTFPPDGKERIKENTLLIGDTFDIGDDYLIQKFYTAVYEVGGVSSVTISIAVTNDPLDTPVYQSTNINIDFDEVLEFTNDRINFIGFTSI